MTRESIQQFLRSIGEHGASQDQAMLCLVEKVVEVLAEPTAADVARVLPKVGNPSQPQRQLAAEAVRLLDAPDEHQPVAYIIASELIRDYQAMWSARFGDGG